MKKLKFLIASILTLSLFAFSSCNSYQDETENDSDTTIVHLEEKMDDIESAESDSLTNQEENAELGKEYTAKYICPDHCKGSGSDHEGECPNCGMELMENPNLEGE